MLLGSDSLVEHSIKYAQLNFSNQDIWINSDDEEIIQLGNFHGINTFLREEKLALDKTSTVEVLKNQIEYFEANQIKCDAVILLQPTNPLRPKNLLKEAIDIFESKNLKDLATFSRLSKKFGSIIKNKYTPLNYIPGQRTQDLEDLYYENGLLYITETENIKSDKIITDDVYPMIVDHVFASVDIDTIDDFKWAEFLFENY